VIIDQALWIPVLAALIAAYAALRAARTNARPADRSVALDELKAAIAVQQNLLDRERDDRRREREEDRDRITQLELEVLACEVGRKKDRERFDRELNEIRREVRGDPT
jgi:hypothetical protein